MLIPDNEIHIYRCSLETTPDKIIQYESILSSDELQKANRYIFEKDRSHYISGRSALRKILAEYLKISSHKIIFSYSEKGKPFIDGSNIKFNLAHSGGKAVYAIAKDKEVGIDIEYKRELTDALQIAERFFSGEEVKEFMEVSGDNIRTAFFNCWTRKEAFIKAIGEGLSYPLKDFTVSLKPGHKPEVKWIKDKDDEVNEWIIRDIETEAGYVSSLAVKSGNFKMVYS